MEPEANATKLKTVNPEIAQQYFDSERLIDLDDLIEECKAYLVELIQESPDGFNTVSTFDIARWVQDFDLSDAETLEAEYKLWLAATCAEFITFWRHHVMVHQCKCPQPTLVCKTCSFEYK